MPPQDWSRIVSASAVPVVIISACGLLCLAFYNRLSSIVSRLRAFHRERLAAQEQLDRAGATGHARGAPHALLLEVLEEQTAHVLRRARLIRSTLVCLLCTIACLTGCSLLSGLGAVWPPAAVGAVVLFVGGMGLMLAAVTFAILELRRALDPVELETEFVAGFTETLGPRAAPAGAGVEPVNSGAGA
jgi:Zn-dependent alcohol dehydrogenase